MKRKKYVTIWEIMSKEKKTIKKTLTYRILGITSSIIIGYMIFGNWEYPTLATAIIETVHTIIYYTLEKVWK